MFVHNLNPELFALGPFHVRWYGLAWLFGFIFSYWFLRRLAKKGGIKNLTPDSLDDLMLYMLIAVIAGARLGHVLFYNAPYYFANPGQILAVWNGGLAFHGGLIGGVLAGWLFCRKRKVNAAQLADAIVIPVALGLFFGRIANFINGELYGVAANVPWCVYFQGAEGCRHPSQLYEAAKNLFLFSALWWIGSRPNLKPGTTFWGFVAGYGFLRSVITVFWRDAAATDPVLFGLPVSLILTLAMAVLGFGMLVRMYLLPPAQRR